MRSFGSNLRPPFGSVLAATLLIVGRPSRLRVVGNPRSAVPAHLASRCRHRGGRGLCAILLFGRWWALNAFRFLGLVRSLASHSLSSFSPTSPWPAACRALRFPFCSQGAPTQTVCFWGIGLIFKRSDEGPAQEEDAEELERRAVEERVDKQRQRMLMQALQAQ